MIPLPEELLLLAYADDGTTRVSGGTLDPGLAGAVLVELALAERVDVVGGRLVLTDPRPTGNAIVDRAWRHWWRRASRASPGKSSAR